MFAAACPCAGASTGTCGQYTATSLWETDAIPDSRTIELTCGQESEEEEETCSDVSELCVVPATL